MVLIHIPYNTQKLYREAVEFIVCRAALNLALEFALEFKSD